MESTEICPFVDNQKVTVVEKNAGHSKLNIIKNLSILSIAVMFYLSATLPCGELQSSINIKDGLGVYAETVRHFVGIFTYMTLPTIIVNKFGLKRTIVFGSMINTLYYFANLRASFATVIPAVIISTMGNTPIWPAMASYLAILSEQASKAFAMSKDHALSILFGVYYSFYYFGYIWGNVASYFILIPVNETTASDENLSKCGLFFCDSDALSGNNTNFARPPDNEIYMLFGLFITLTLLASLVIGLFLDPIEQTKSTQSVKLLIFKTIRDLFTPKHLLLLPLNFLRGISISFLSSDYTKAFVSCAWGIHNIGLVMIAFGIVCGLSSLSLGRLVQYTGRISLFVSALLIHVAVAIFITQWNPATEHLYLFYLVPILLGFCNAVWESQVAAIFALMFPNDREVIYSIYTFGEVLGSTIARSYSAALCTQYKLLIYMVLVLVGFICYIVAEFKYLRIKKEK